MSSLKRKSTDHVKLAPDVEACEGSELILTEASRMIDDSLKTEDSGSIGPLFRAIWPRLLPFQREGVAFSIVKGGRCCICDEMGLGKTVQALAVATYYERSDR